MKTRKLMLVGLGFALTLSLSACGKSDDASQSASAASAAVAPVASVAVEASAAAASDAAPAAAVATAAAGGDNSAVGEKTFKGTCFMCHQTGAAGAPLFGNKADWAPHIAKGKDTLYKHALEGFTGNNGTMPAHGGNPSLKDDEVKAAVDYMVSKAQ